MRTNRCDIGELFMDEVRSFDRRYGEYLSQLEAQHERRVREQRGRDEVEHGLAHELARASE